jgi:hypothetical protein
VDYTSRDAWGARYSSGYALRPGAVGLVVAHHAGAPDVDPGASEAHECQVMRERLEQYHVDTLFTTRPRAERHIGYNWVVMPSGRVYEGVGWGRIGAHAPGVNSKSVGVLICMNAARKPPQAAAVDSFRRVLAMGVRLGYIGDSYTIEPHSKFKATDCPGDGMRAILPQLRHDIIPALPVLRYGDTGPHVRTLQRLLGMSEMLVHRFGPATLEQGLEADGVVGRRTWERLLRGVP